MFMLLYCYNSYWGRCPDSKLTILLSIAAASAFSSVSFCFFWCCRLTIIDFRFLPSLISLPLAHLQDDDYNFPWLFPDFFQFPWLFPDHFPIPWLFQVFQVGGHPAICAAVFTTAVEQYNCAFCLLAYTMYWHTNRVNFSVKTYRKTLNISLNWNWQII